MKIDRAIFLFQPHTYLLLFCAHGLDDLKTKLYLNFDNEGVVVILY